MDTVEATTTTTTTTIHMTDSTTVSPSTDEPEGFQEKEEKQESSLSLSSLSNTNNNHTTKTGGAVHAQPPPTTTTTTPPCWYHEFDSIKTPRPLRNREHTNQVIQSILKKPQETTTIQTSTTQQQQQRLARTNVHGEGPLILSDIPDSCRRRDSGSSSSSSSKNTSPDSGVILGIDEAGRGSVLGPMVYGCAYWNKSDADKIPKDFNDSKQLSEKTRDALLDKILQNDSAIGFAVRILHASEISRNMLRNKTPYNLNAMSHNAAIDIIRKLLQAGVDIQACYIDTVGIAHHYQRRLEQEFPGIDFTVESKADANYAVCSAASVVAKVLRDALLQNWTFSEAASSSSSNSCLLPGDNKFGSGYPSDPTCKAWMQNNLAACPVFGFPDVVRFSWKPAKDALEKSEKAVKVTFQADLDQDDDDHDNNNNDKDQFKISGIKRQQQESMSAFVGKKDGTPPKKKRYPYFQKRKLQVVSKL
jgi:ribonuclease H2 subunit A